MSVRGAILAGGMASRFGGRPKGLARVGGERIIDRVAQVMRAALGSPPLLVANDPTAESWIADLEVRKDLLEGCGSLGGIYTALSAAAGPVLVVAWDMPFVSSELLSTLARGADDVDVLVPASAGPHGVEPMCAVYGPGCTTAIREQLANEDYRATGFHEQVTVGTLSPEEVSRHGDPETLFFNVNTEEDLARAEEIWRAQHI